MAERRMFAKTIIDSDAFIDMPLSTQALYFHLSMRADDDGFVGNWKKILLFTGLKEDDMKKLAEAMDLVLSKNILELDEKAFEENKKRAKEIVKKLTEKYV